MGQKFALERPWNDAPPLPRALRPAQQASSCFGEQARREYRRDAEGRRVHDPPVLCGGDPFRVVHPGEKFHDVPYQELKAAGAGMVIVEHDGWARIE